jgi:hypothetical protein
MNKNVLIWHNRLYYCTLCVVLWLLYTDDVTKYYSVIEGDRPVSIHSKESNVAVCGRMLQFLATATFVNEPVEGAEGTMLHLLQ